MQGRLAKAFSLAALLRLVLVLFALGRTVRGADTSRLDLAPQSAGLYALSIGSDDHEMLRHGLVMYNALHAWHPDCQGQTHNWPPPIN